MKIIDIHCHCGSNRYRNNAITPERMKQDLKRWNVEKIVASSMRGLFYDFKAGNRETLEYCESLAEVYGYIYVNPYEVKASIREVRKYASHPKMIGIKTRAKYHGLILDDPRYLEILDAVESLGLPILNHSWGLDEVHGSLNVSKIYPYPVILGHMGADNWQTTIDLAKDCPNAYLEPCGSLDYPDKIAKTLEVFGADRLLFGSDYNLFSFGWSIGMVEAANPTPAQRRKIYWENAQKLFDFNKG